MLVWVRLKEESRYCTQPIVMNFVNTNVMSKVFFSDFVKIFGYRIDSHNHKIENKMSNASILDDLTSSHKLRLNDKPIIKPINLQAIEGQCFQI